MAIFDVNPTQLIYKVAEELKKEEAIKAPEWAPFVKTGVSRERQPSQKNWWHIRAAAILRKLVILGPVGTNKLRRQYGGRKNRGMKPDKFYIGGGNIIRKIMQQLEQAGLAKKAEKDVHKGRIITPKGHKLLSQAAITLLKENPPQPITTAEPPKVASKSKPEEAREEKKPAKKRTKKTSKKKEEKPEAEELEEKQ